MTEAYAPPLTPVQVEAKLLDLVQQNLRAYQDLREAEHNYESAKARHQIAAARARLATYADHKDWTVGRRDDVAMVETEGLRLELAGAEAVVKSARAKASAVRTQADLIRSIGLSVRTSMEVG
ncbi:hypothetical protein [Streptomyces mirabilis]|uniref:hypothetical protein n=1 Tax=Streptomyces mirabilis TaxID=68239 RepID=UPI00368224A8